MPMSLQLPLTAVNVRCGNREKVIGLGLSISILKHTLQSLWPEACYSLVSGFRHFGIRYSVEFGNHPEIVKCLGQSSVPHIANLRRHGFPIRGSVLISQNRPKHASRSTDSGMRIGVAGRYVVAIDR